MANESGDFLYHGSSTAGIELLEPRQAFNGSYPDGDPAVFATRNIEYAIFMALIGSNRWGGWDHTRHPGQGFYIYPEFVEYLTSDEYDISGHVYVLPRTAFTEAKADDYRSIKPIQPLGSFLITVSDLPKNITILDEPHPRSRRQQLVKEWSSGQWGEV